MGVGRAVVLVLAVALAACGCSDGGAGRAAPSTARATPPPAFANPQVGACRAPISDEILAAASDPRPAIPCDQPHGSETVFVGQLPADVAMLAHEEASALDRGTAELGPALERCEKEYDAYVGVTRIEPDGFRPDNLVLAFFIPAAEEWAKGARWLRCDVATAPFAGQAVRATTEPLRGIGARNPLDPAWRTCFRDVTGSPAARFEGFTPCAEPHKAEALVVFQVTDPKVDTLAGDPKALGDYVRNGFLAACTQRVAARIGLSTTALAERGDIGTGSVALEVSRWATQRRARRVQCLALVAEPTVGTLEALGSRPLPTP